jgi:hypothetical protein
MLLMTGRRRRGSMEGFGGGSALRREEVPDRRPTSSTIRMKGFMSGVA